ncbi:hypothetical protein CERZMDRAFT_91146 [Cercospora zeae-maydis SCOH1-5]|uniref:Uncharacterized protein n=1 Tax=Cercospora zeae-maydis SCOH1-5 TaxID=717836 RepID=A0A6A6FA89_9PEZI|nr:hypothetical protein CERZMDRAFT_91146 [Cercospora zeae-maydis SCOH1-5]
MWQERHVANSSVAQGTAAVEMCCADLGSRDCIAYASFFANPQLGGLSYACQIDMFTLHDERLLILNDIIQIADCDPRFGPQSAETHESA